MKSFRPHIERAIALLGSQVRLAKEAGCSQQYISWLLTEGKQVGPKMAIAFERATDGQVSRHDLCPDVFGEAPAKEPAE